MVKARMRGNIYLLGLSEKNIELIKQGKPVKVNLKEMGLKADAYVVIMYGKTEQDIYQKLKPGIDPLKTTIVHEQGSKEN